MKRLVIAALLIMMFPVFAEREIIQSQILENCDFNDKIIRYAKIVNCRIENSEIYSAEIIDSAITNSNIHEVDIRHSEINGGILRSVYSTGGSVVRNSEIWTSTIEGTYIEHSSGGQLTIREGDVSNSEFSQTNIRNASITDSSLDGQSTTSSVDIRTSPVPKTSSETQFETGSVLDEETFEISKVEDPFTETIIVDRKPETHNIIPQSPIRKPFWKAFFCKVPVVRVFLAC